MLHLLQMSSFKMLTLFFLRFKILGNFHFWKCPSSCVPASSEGATPTNTMTSSSHSSSLYTSTVQIGTSGSSTNTALLLHHWVERERCICRSLPSNLLPSFHPPRIFSICTLSRSWLFFYTSCSLFSLTCSGFFNGMLVVSEPGALNRYTLSRLIRLIFWYPGIQSYPFFLFPDPWIL